MEAQLCLPLRGGSSWSSAPPSGARAPPGKWPPPGLAISPPQPDTKEADPAADVAAATEDG